MGKLLNADMPGRKGSGRVWLLAAGLALALAAGAAPLAGPASGQMAENAMAVDAVPGGAIDATRTVTGGDPFDITINVTSVGTPYQAYQFNVRYDMSILQFVTGQNHQPGGLAACSAPLDNNSSIYLGCASFTNETTDFMGVTDTLTFRCIADGVSPLHLLTDEEVGITTGTNMAAGNAQMVPMRLTDASITCASTGATPQPEAVQATATASAVETRVAAGLTPYPGTDAVAQTGGAQAGQVGRTVGPGAGAGGDSVLDRPIVIVIALGALVAGAAIVGSVVWRRRQEAGGK